MNKFLTAVFFITGSCIGAGMLGMPLISFDVGFPLTVALFFVAFGYMICTALLLTEVSYHFDAKVSFVMMIERLLGKKARTFCSIFFFFLMYAVLTAYTIGAAASVDDFLSPWLTQKQSMFAMTALFGLALFVGTHALDLLNRLLLVILGASYFALVLAGLPHVELRNLAHVNLHSSLFTLPILIFAFTYHNLIPSLRNLLSSQKAIRNAVIAGALIPLFVYLLWEYLLLGILPQSQASEIRALIAQGTLIGDILRTITASSWIVIPVQIFTFCAIATSYIANSLSMVDLFKNHFRYHRVILVLAVVIPPLLIAYSYPDIFLSALSAAGAYGIIVLFGLVPIAMAWKLRQRHPENRRLLPGGKLILALLILFSLTVITVEIIR